MVLQAIAFYVLAAAMLGAGVMVITARNPVHAVLFLIATFFAAAGLFVLLGAEFLAMILVVVYVGAVAVLFLFVVMMLDVDFDQLRAGFSRYLPVGVVVALVLVGEMAAVAVGVANRGAAAGQPMMTPGAVTNAEAIGRVLYTDYVYFFQAAGLILLVAMIGAIVLTLRHRTYVRRQSILDQTARSPRTGMRLVSIKSGEGIAE
jgi:NADH-quinone oxidoreductase subunit J